MGDSGTADSLVETLQATSAADHQDRAPTVESRLVLVVEADRPLASSACYGLAGIHAIRVGRGRKREAERAGGVLTVRVPDRRMSSEHAEIQFMVNGWWLKDRGSRNGCFIDGTRIIQHQLHDDEFIELGHTIFSVQRDCPPGDIELADARAPVPGLTTMHSGLQRELERAAQLATTPVSCLIQGESGTGKEVIAKALHALSDRSGEFVGVNTAAIPDSLIESELFGHKKGAFSGAVSDRPGLIRSADQGTLFLDEIGDLSLSAQAVLLRVLQEREVRPVGDTRAIPVDIRLVSATHRDLAAQVQREEFRRDLYARIAGTQVCLPALRDRRVDLGVLIAALLPRVAANSDTLTFSMEAVRALLRHEWPMNIRELENCLLTSAALASAGRIERSHLPPGLGDPDPSQPRVAPGPAEQPAPPRKPVNLTRQDIVAALDEHDHNIAYTARALGLSRQALYRRIQHFDIPRPGRKDAD